MDTKTMYLLDRIIDHLAERHPDLETTTVAEHVYRTYGELRAAATIATYLPWLTLRRADVALASMMHA